MQKVRYQREVKHLRLPDEVKLRLSETLGILDENYGDNRDVDVQLGGYALIAENLFDTKYIQKNLIKDTVPEEVEEIVTNDGLEYNLILFIVSIYRKLFFIF
ncbi:hypothetical protein [Turicibacter bilis]|uniref:Uncharacterized protein n=1 Tax=Turicibacter bilis TaxID=2735723 RepID=A0ABY5JIR6_9FIRM|nr:hypothetical protein [Turicibacter bilis]MBS3199520.1 hypothetical protein [Turicibacter bilis]UUF06114.1 hypothetical protein J0J69_00540 [Turicibacter bilis]